MIRRSAARWTLSCGLLTFLLLACGPSTPRDISYGNEACAHCHMTIADPRFSAELVTRTGKAITFDDAECMATWLSQHPTERATGWVVSFVDSRWLPADSVTFLKSGQFHTPMASGLIALRPGAEADSVQRALGGQLIDWKTVRRDLGDHPHPPHAG